MGDGKKDAYEREMQARAEEDASSLHEGLQKINDHFAQSKTIEESFDNGLEKLINKYSMENGSDTPDYMLADYLCDCLDNFNRTVRARTNWYASKPAKEQR